MQIGQYKNNGLVVRRYKVNGQEFQIQRDLTSRRYRLFAAFETQFPDIIPVENLEWFGLTKSWKTIEKITLPLMEEYVQNYRKQLNEQYKYRKQFISAGQHSQSA